MNRRLRITSCAAAAVLLGGSAACSSLPFFGGGDEGVPARPNILIVVADDLGYSDLGAYGSEIATPTVDALAKSGLIATDFYVSPRGAPTRAMLLTGVDHHLAGLGNLPRRITPEQEGMPGYEGHLNDDVVTVASLLREAGYRTYMAGKWELGFEPEQNPARRGFERSFVLLDGAASYWDDMKSARPGRDLATYTRDGAPVEKLPEGYYSTDYFTDFVIESIGSGDSDGRPFFAYLSYQAPHGPLAAPADWLDRYRGRYDTGYDSIREARLLELQRADLVHKDVKSYPGIPTVPTWSELDDDAKRQQARKMEIYAAMLENLDFEVGRLLDHLREIGAYDDTLVFVLSDNGAEPGDRGVAGMDARSRDWYAQHFPDGDFENWGRKGSFIEYGAAWAQVSMVPFRLFKGTQAEGGVRSPLVVSGPGVRSGRTTRTILHVTDLPATVLDVAEVSYPERFRGRRVAPLQGRSLVPILEGRWGAERGFRNWLGFELGGDRAVRERDWKLVRMTPPFGTGEWRLFRLGYDPAELYDRAEAKPEKVEELAALWEQYAVTNQLVLPDAKADPEAQKPSASDR